MMATDQRRTQGLTVRDLVVTHGATPVVRGVSFDVAPGRLVALAGESGSGKSVTSLAVLRLLPPELHIGGRVEFGGRNVLELGEEPLRLFRASDARMVFQDPWSALNPMLSVGAQLMEAIPAAEKLSRSAARAKAARLLERVGVSDPERRLQAYPGEMSGGILQRIVIAMALAASPALIVCDEPTTALDATTEVQIMDLIRSLCREMGAAVILTSHDLGIIGQYSDELMVMYAGQIVDQGRSSVLLEQTPHPYTRALVSSIPHYRQKPRTPLPTLEGRPPMPSEVGAGCALAPRCPLRQQICVERTPPLADNPATGGRTACWITNPALAG